MSHNTTSHEPLVGRGILTEPLGFIRLMPIGSLRTVRPTFLRFKGREQVRTDQEALRKNTQIGEMEGGSIWRSVIFGVEIGGKYTI